MKKNIFKKNYKKSAFTLIELMVVITIIGILAIIVLPNLGSVRGRGQDTAIKEQMAQLRTIAAIYYDDNYGYSSSAVVAGSGGVACPTTTGNTTFAGTVFVDTDFVRSAVGIERNSSIVPTCYLGGSSSNGKAQTWVVLAKLRQGTSGKGYWCVDSTGNAMESDNSPVVTGGIDYSCQ